MKHSLIKTFIAAVITTVCVSALSLSAMAAGDVCFVSHHHGGYVYYYNHHGNGCYGNNGYYGCPQNHYGHRPNCVNGCQYSYR